MNEINNDELMLQLGEVIDCNRLNVREAPSFDASIVRTLNCSDNVVIFGEPIIDVNDKIWYQLDQNEYVVAEYIKILDFDTEIDEEEENELE